MNSMGLMPVGYNNLIHPDYLIGSHMASYLHTPVLLEEVLEYIEPRVNGLYLDCTFGGGGYAEAILRAASCNLIAIDRDPRASQEAELLKSKYSERFSFVQGCFGDMGTRFSDHKEQFDGIVFDLGVSSPQIDEPERGFSFRFDAPLDMRMGDSGQTARDAVNTLPEEELANLIFKFGEERYARRIARAISLQRKIAPIMRTLELAELIRKVVPKSRDGIDPATRTFQALRIYVNDELGELQRGLRGALDLLAPHGVLVVVSFHSLEDRIVKQFINEHSRSQALSRYLPMKEHFHPTLINLTSKPVTPGALEIGTNPRSRSAKLRAAKKLEERKKS